MTNLLAAEPSAGGAAIDQVIIATAFGLLFTAGLIVICLGHRSGRIGLLSWGGRTAERFIPIPGWAGVPATIALLTLLPTLFGLQWDESLHITTGRDEGPLANPSHYVLLQGIFGGFAAGVIAMAMADRRVPASAIRLPGAWPVPAGGVLATIGASVALLGFPLDDVWHRLYGQDVTLWGPTHVMMIAGMSIAVLGVVVLVVEGMRARAGGLHAAPIGAGRGRHPLQMLSRIGLGVMLPASLLLVLSLLQGEFDWGVPQYRLLLHPMMVLGAAAVALVAARIFMGRGAAFAAVAGFLVVRGAISLIIGPGLDKPWHMFPLYLVEAGIVELVALRISARRPLALGLVSGALIGTVGLASEWAWSGLFPYPWTDGLWPEAVVAGFVFALAGGAIGAWLGSHLMVVDPIRTRALRWSAVAAAVVVTAGVGYALHESGGEPISGEVTLTEVGGGSGRTVEATVRLDPPDAAEDASWIGAIAWQGGGLVSEPLDRVGEGVYETRTPLPVHGSWKSALRLHTGDRLLGLPVFLPADEAIPVDELPAPASFDREFEPEKAFLQREAKDVGEGLLFAGTATVALICFLLLGISAAVLHRLAATAPGPRPAATAAPRETERDRAEGRTAVPV